jgi:hypothetical protein
MKLFSKLLFLLSIFSIQIHSMQREFRISDRSWQVLKEQNRLNIEGNGIYHAVLNNLENTLRSNTIITIINNTDNEYRIDNNVLEPRSRMTLDPIPFLDQQLRFLLENASSLGPIAFTRDQILLAVGDPALHSILMIRLTQRFVSHVPGTIDYFINIDHQPVQRRALNVSNGPVNVHIIITLQGENLKDSRIDFA